MSAFKKIFLKKPSSPLFWLLMGLVFKGIPFLMVILNHPYRDIQGIWGATQADDSSYLLPIDNLLRYGTYTPDFRMPGYGIVYLLFRLVFTPTVACNALILLQVILASASVYYLSLAARNIFHNDVPFYFTFYLFLVCPFSNFFDAYIASESLCSSILIFGIYFFTQYFNIYKGKYLFFAGLFLAWAMFIRPVFGGVLAICCLMILIQRNSLFTLKIKHAILFLIPLFLLDGAWTYRNYQTHKKFIPFTTTGAFFPNAANSYPQPLFEFTQSWGGACSLTNKLADVNWFQYYYPGMTPILHFDSLPDDIYTSAFKKDSLVRLKKMIIALRNPSIDTITAAVYQHDLRAKLTEYKLSVRKEKPFLYFIKAPLKMVAVMLYGPVTRNYLERGKSIPFLGKLIIAFNYFIYLAILLSGLAGIVLLFIQGLQHNYLLFIAPSIVLYTILIHPYMFRFFDSRFILPVFPFIILCSACTLSKLLQIKLKPE